MIWIILFYPIAIALIVMFFMGAFKDRPNEEEEDLLDAEALKGFQILHEEEK